MTHDELLAKIDDLPEILGLAEFKFRHDALRAVVELHKDVSGACMQCLGVDGTEYDYPCPTIQAIEKALI